MAERRLALVAPEHLNAFLAEALGSPLPGWTEWIDSEPEQDPEPDRSMVCVRASVQARGGRKDGRLVVELVYVPVESL